MSTVRTATAASFKNILFLTDFSPASAGALAYSLAFARHFKARLFPAHVMDLVVSEAGVVPSEQSIKDQEERKQRQLSRLVEYNGISFQPLLSRCDFEVAMSHWISEHGIDLIVVGTHGRNGVQRFLLGSTSEVVLHNATCPVLTIGPHVDAPRIFSLTLDNILFAAELAQWSPLLSAGFVIAPLSLLWVAKPSIGLALSVARPSRWPVIGLVVLGGIAFLTQPHWFGAWRHALSSTSSIRGVGFPYIAPILMPGGFLALLALLRWRRPEARLIAALACVPQTMLLYEAVPLFLVPRTLRETELLVLLSFVALGFMPHTSAYAPDIDASGRWIVIFLYLPATLMVLRRPNEGGLPAWIESRVGRLPRWLRGLPAEAA